MDSNVLVRGVRCAISAPQLDAGGQRFRQYGRTAIGTSSRDLDLERIPSGCLPLDEGEI